MPKISNKKWLKICILSSVVIVLFFSFAYLSFADARTLENEYPKIPLLEDNFSLNDIYEAITSGTGPAKDAFANKDPLSSIILYFYTMSVMVVGLIAFGVIIMAGFKLLTSGSNPSLRNTAKSQLQAALMGIVILLGSWLLLNTINPELTILHKPGEAPGTVTAPNIRAGSIQENNPFGAIIGLETLNYGGVVVYGSNSTDGLNGKSDTILHSVANFNDGTYLASNNDIEAIKILGNCQIALKDNSGGTSPNMAPFGGSLTGAFSTFNNNVKGLVFRQRDCLGYSIRIYDQINYNGKSKLLITDEDDLGNTTLMPSGGRANDKIESIQYSIIDTDPQSIFMLCEDDTRGTPCIEIASPTLDLSNVKDIKGVDHDFKDKTSSIYINSSQNRQAGVILYEHANFKGRYEIFITSDQNLANNYIKNNKVSSIKIIGNYSIYLYDNTGATPSGSFIQIDNRDSSAKYYTSIEGGIGQTTTLSRPNNILEITDLNNLNFCFKYKDNDPIKNCEEKWHDRISSIRIFISEDTLNQQTLLPSCIARTEIPIGSDDFFCQL